MAQDGFSSPLRVSGKELFGPDTHCVPSKTMKEAKSPLDFQHHDARK